MRFLCLDGLEYNFVKEWNLTNLQQRQYGKLEVPIHKHYKVPYTPEVWSAFITGKVRDSTRRRLQWSLHILRLLRRFIPISLHLGQKLRYGHSSTLFTPTRTSSVNHAFGHRNINLSEAVEQLYCIYERMKQQILDNYERGAKIQYMHFPDSIHHYQFIRPEAISSHYQDLDDYARKVRETVEPEALIIVSDHGFSFKTQNHTMYGFYSSSWDLNPQPKKITDFYELMGR